MCLTQSMTAMIFIQTKKRTDFSWQDKQNVSLNLTKIGYLLMFDRGRHGVRCFFGFEVEMEACWASRKEHV